MAILNPKSVHVSLEVRSVRGHAGLAELTCSKCHQALELHQPDSANPDRLLGTCPGCDAWFIIDDLADQDRYRMLVIPAALRVKLDDLG